MFAKVGRTKEPVVIVGDQESLIAEEPRRDGFRHKKRATRRVIAKYYSTRGVADNDEPVEIVVIVASKSHIERVNIPDVWRRSLGFSGYEALISEPFPLMLANVFSLVTTAILHDAIARDEGLMLNRENYDDLVQEVIAHGLRVPLTPDLITGAVATGRIVERKKIGQRGLAVFGGILPRETDEVVSEDRLSG